MRKKSFFQSNRESSTSVGSKTAMSTQFLTAHARSSTSSINRRRRLTEDTSNLIRSFPPSTKKELVCSKADTYSCMGVPHPKAEQTTTSCRRLSSRNSSNKLAEKVMEGTEASLWIRCSRAYVLQRTVLASRKPSRILSSWRFLWTTSNLPKRRNLLKLCRLLKLQRHQRLNQKT